MIETHQMFQRLYQTLSRVFLPPGVSRTFAALQCDRSLVEDLLGLSTGISDNNIMFYLGLVEQKTNQLLTIQDFIKSKVSVVAFNNNNNNRQQLFVLLPSCGHT